MKLHHIYLLRDPRDGAIRYVGVTYVDLPKRLACHISQARAGRVVHRCCWLRSLLAAGVRPVIELIESVPEEQRVAREQYWIGFHRGQGCDLVNVTDGGEGTVGYRWSRESIERLRAAMKGKKHGPCPEERRRKISEATRGKQRSAAARANISAAQKRRIWLPLSEETKKKMSAAQAKISPAQVDEMFRLYATGQFTYRSLGEKLGLPKGTVGTIFYRSQKSKRVDLTPEGVREAQALSAAGLKQKEIAARLGVTSGVIGALLRALPRPNGGGNGGTKLSPEQVRSLRAEPRPQPLHVLAERYGVSTSLVSMILRNLVWKQIK